MVRLGNRTYRLILGLTTFQELSEILGHPKHLRIQVFQGKQDNTYSSFQ